MYELQKSWIVVAIRSAVLFRAFSPSDQLWNGHKSPGSASKSMSEQVRPRSFPATPYNPTQRQWQPRGTKGGDCAMEKWRRCGRVEFGNTGNARESRRGYERCINMPGDCDQIDADCYFSLKVANVACHLPCFSLLVLGLSAFKTWFGAKLIRDRQWRPSAKTESW